MWRMFAVICSTLQAVSLARWIGFEGERLNASEVGQYLPSCRMLGNPCDAESGKGMGMSRCWHSCWMLFRVYSLWDFSGTVQSASLSQPHFVHAGDHPDQAGYSSDWWGKLSLSLSVLGMHCHSCFPSWTVILPLPSCVIIKNRKACYLVMEKFAYFISHVLQWALGVLSCLVLVLSMCSCVQYWLRLGWARFMYKYQTLHRPLCSMGRSQSPKCWAAGRVALVC